MKFNLTKPCSNCPFSRDSREGWLGEDRAIEIGEGLAYQKETFSCHKTNESDDEGNGVQTDKSQHCAGALIMLERMERPNQMMRISERFGGYDRTKLDMDSNVFDDHEEFIDHHI